jgi:hypothetical protein
MGVISRVEHIAAKAEAFENSCLLVRTFGARGGGDDQFFF